MGHRLTPNFHSDEFTNSATAQRLQIDNIPSGAVLRNLHRLAIEMEKVRAIAGKPILILSGYRCKQLNRAVGGVPHSFHLDGCAADFKAPPGWTHDALQKAIGGDPGVDFDLVLEERAADGGHWLHFQIPRPGTIGRRLLLDAELANTGGAITRVTAG